jgi:hypothetical protein
MPPDRNSAWLVANADTLWTPASASIVRYTGITPASFRNGHKGGILNRVDLPKKRG